MLFFGDVANKSLSEKIASGLKVPVLYPELTIFPDGEQKVRLLDEVVGQKVIVLKSLCPPVDHNLIEFCFLLDALKRNGVEDITAIVPYVGYMRADHMFRTGDPVPFEVIIDMMERAGLTKILFVDPHTIRAQELFHIPVLSETALRMFADEIKKLPIELSKTTIVTPDMGGIRRIKMLSEMLDNLPYASINKDRDLDTGNVTVASMTGEIRQNAIIVDDMISSGGTIVKAVEALRAKNVDKIYVFATHAVFSGDASQLLQGLAVEGVYVTDSIPIPASKQFKNLEVVSVAQLVIHALK